MKNKKRVGTGTGEQYSNDRYADRGSQDHTDSIESRIQRRRQVQLAYYYRNRKLTPKYEERQATYELFSLTGKKKCKICEEFKTPEEFYPSKTGAYRLTDDCKECRTSISLENYYFRKARKKEKIGN